MRNRPRQSLHRSGTITTVNATRTSGPLKHALSDGPLTNPRLWAQYRRSGSSFAIFLMFSLGKPEHWRWTNGRGCPQEGTHAKEYLSGWLGSIAGGRLRLWSGEWKVATALHGRRAR